MPKTVPGLAERFLWRIRHAIRQRPGTSKLGASVEPVTVAGLFRVASGIGESARLCADALEADGIEVTRIDLSEGFGQADLEDQPNRFARWPRTGGTLIVHLNGPEMERALFLARAFRGGQRKLVGAWVWELPCPPPDWASASTLLDEIWVPSVFVKEAISPVCRCPVKVVPYVLGDLSSVPPKPASDNVSILVMGDGRSSFSRKNIVGSIQAFKQARLPKNVRLVVKLRNLMEVPELGLRLLTETADDARIELLDRTLSRKAHLALLQSCDILMSLHRAEGFGLPIAEAMALGKAVIATNWSANTEFMDAHSSVLVPAREIALNDPAGVYSENVEAVWAEPDVGYAAEALSQLASDPARRAQLGKAAKAKVQRFTSRNSYLYALGLLPPALARR